MNERYYETSKYKRIMKYVWEDQMLLWYRMIKNICQIIDFACPYDGRADIKELEKIENYQDLVRELRKI